MLVKSEEDLPLVESFGPGTRAYLADESKAWALDANGEWQEIALQSGGGSGGGGSSGDSGIFIVKFRQPTEDENITGIVSDKTVEEVEAAYNAGKVLLGVYQMNTYGFWVANTEDMSFNTWYGYFQFFNPGPTSNLRVELGCVVYIQDHWEYDTMYAGYVNPNPSH